MEPHLTSCNFTWLHLTLSDLMWPHLTFFDLTWPLLMSGSLFSLVRLVCLVCQYIGYAPCDWLSDTLTYTNIHSHTVFLLFCKQTSARWFYCRNTILFIHLQHTSLKAQGDFSIDLVGTTVATYYPNFQPNSTRISLSKHHFLHLEHTSLQISLLKHHFLHLEHTSLQAQGDFSIDLGRYYCCNILPKIPAKFRSDFIVKSPFSSFGTYEFASAGWFFNWFG